MPIRKLIIGLAAAGIVASMFGVVGAHDKLAACNGFVTAYEVGDQIIYNDDRGRNQDGSDAEGDGIPTVPAVTAGWWLYIETNGHPGLQTGGDHAALGEGGGSAGFTDSCVNNEDDHASIDKDAILF